MCVTGLHDLPQKKNYTTRRFFCYTYLPQKKNYTNYNIHCGVGGLGRTRGRGTTTIPQKKHLIQACPAGVTPHTQCVTCVALTGTPSTAIRVILCPEIVIIKFSALLPELIQRRR